MSAPEWDCQVQIPALPPAGGPLPHLLPSRADRDILNTQQGSIPTQ